MISYHPRPAGSEKPLFSILIPTWNNLPFVRLCVESLRQNSTYTHQLILHINEGADGTLQWAQQEGLDYTFSAQNVGICFACNASASLAKADYIVYMNDDMYACPGWDKHLYDAIRAYGRDDFYFSATMIERKDAACGFVSSPHDYGSTVEDFREAQLHQDLPQLSIPDWQGANFPPSVMHRNYWDLIGGFSVEFSPGMYSDPDLCRKLWAAGVRNFKGVGSSLVYHFMSKSIGRVKRNNGKKQFLIKWGITARTFFDFYTHLHQGQQSAAYRGILTDPPLTLSLRWQWFLSAVKRWF
ncbi:MAG: glycosyltransferase [Spirosomataceae bacterium]